MFFNFFGEPKPFHTGHLPAENGHSVYFQQFGNAAGEPVLCFHGGPGSYGKPKHAALFNLKKHRVVLFDQRGCGKSTPAGETLHNTTNDLLNDAKRLLDHLNIKHTFIFGGSWGATLALLFAQRHPQMIRKMVISQTFLARTKDIEWISNGSRAFYPDMMDIMEKKIPKGKSLREHYADLVFSNDETERLTSTRFYGSYEHMIGTLNPAFSEFDPAPDHVQAYKIYMHYDRQNYGVNDNAILDNIETIRHIPALILHNRLDMICPVEQSWLLHKALKNSKLVIVPDKGHGSDLLKEVTKEEINAFL